MQAKFAHILVEIGSRCGLHTKSISPQRDLVQVKLHDLRLGQRGFDARGEDRFLDLAGVAHFICEQQILRHLLRDCGGTTLARFSDIADNCRDDAGIIKT